MYHYLTDSEYAPENMAFWIFIEHYLLHWSISEKDASAEEFATKIGIANKPRARRIPPKKGAKVASKVELCEVFASEDEARLK